MITEKILSRVQSTDAVLFDLDGVITDTANLHAASWKQMFDEYLMKRATQSRRRFRPFDITTTIGFMSMANPASTAFATFSNHAVSSCLKAARTTHRRPKLYTDSGTVRTNW